MKCFAPKATGTTTLIQRVDATGYKTWLKQQPKPVQKWLKHTKFEGEAGQHATVPAEDGGVAFVVFCVGKDDPTWAYAGLASALPEGRYTIEGRLSVDESNRAALGWALASYSFDRYKKNGAKPRELVWPKKADRKEVTRLAQATFLVRDLVNTPAEDMGPTELAAEAKKLAQKHKARVTIIKGKALLDKNYPAIHAVGRACDDEPRLIDITWGRPKDPKVTLVGKGVCFDTGGLNLKPSSGITLMKKDMGGAAHVLGLAHAIMDAKLKVRLRVLVPAVENSVSSNAIRPLDVIDTRKGLTVEIGNTDAEGRLILCDALAEADRESPDLLIDFATLTGAARVALGTEVAVLFSNDEKLARDILAGGDDCGDKCWRLPLHQEYKRYLESRVADLNNISRQPYGGAITAALFLEHFVGDTTRWAHFDVMAYNSEAREGRPIGGEAMGLRATYEAIKKRYA